MYEDALAQDPLVFDYDGVYDSIQAARVAPKQQDKMQRQSKYISSLLDQAAQRKREQVWDGEKSGKLDPRLGCTAMS